MTQVTTAQARDKLAALVDKVVGGERITLTRRGKPVAIMVPIEDGDLLSRLEDRLDLLDARKALEEWEKDGRQTIPLDQVLAEMGISR